MEQFLPYQCLNQSLHEAQRPRAQAVSETMALEVLLRDSPDSCHICPQLRRFLISKVIFGVLLIVILQGKALNVIIRPRCWYH